MKRPLGVAGFTAGFAQDLKVIRNDPHLGAAGACDVCKIVLFQYLSVLFQGF